MATAYSNELTAVQGPAALAGLGGAPQESRSTSLQGKVQVMGFSFTIPATGPGSAQNDVVIIGLAEVTAKIVDATVFFDNLGTSSTLAMGKIDPNNAANTDANHYIPASPATPSGHMDLVQNMLEEVGADPLGDQSTGQTAPYFGQNKIQFTLTLGGAAPTTGANIVGRILYVSGT